MAGALPSQPTATIALAASAVITLLAICGLSRRTAALVPLAVPVLLIAAGGAGLTELRLHPRWKA